MYSSLNRFSITTGQGYRLSYQFSKYRKDLETKLGMNISAFQNNVGRLYIAKSDSNSVDTKIQKDQRNQEFTFV